MGEKFDYVWPFPKFPLSNPERKRWNVCSSLVSFGVFSCSKIWLEKFNTVTLHNGKILYDLIENRGKNTPLITVSNHTCCIDDPLIWGVLKWKSIFDKSMVRWTLAAHNICFTKRWHGKMFALGKCVPVIRGKGVYQQGMDFVLDRLKEGDWVHMFPEGRVNLEQKWIRFKWGVGRLVAECSKVPVVLPVCHCGTEDVLPNTKPYVPQMGKHVTIAVGDPIYFNKSLEAWRRMGYTKEQIRKAVTDKIQEEIDKLYAKTQKLHKINVSKS